MNLIFFIVQHFKSIHSQNFTKMKVINTEILQCVQIKCVYAEESVRRITITWTLLMFQIYFPYFFRLYNQVLTAHPSEIL